MEVYEVIMTPDAITDIVYIRNYIADVLLVPDIALSYIRVIREAISKRDQLQMLAKMKLD